MKTLKTRSAIRLHLSAMALAFTIGVPVAHAETMSDPDANPVAMRTADVNAPTMSPKVSRRLAKASRELSEGMAGFQDMLFNRGTPSDEREALAATQQWHKSTMP